LLSRPRTSTPRRISIANRKGRAVNATFVDDATKHIHETQCSLVFAIQHHRCVIASHEMRRSECALAFIPVIDLD
jgi:hypothetical protein